MKSEFENSIKRSASYEKLVYQHGERLFILDDGKYKIAAVQLAWEIFKEKQNEVDELQKRVDAVKGLAQTLWEKSEEKHQQGKVWESKTLGECADEILDVLEQALNGGIK